MEKVGGKKRIGLTPWRTWDKHINQMTPNENMQFWRKWNRFQQRHELTFTKLFKKALQQQVRAFEKSKDPMLIPAYPIYTVLKELYSKVGPLWANEIRKDIRGKTITKARLPMGFNEDIINLMREYFGIDLLNDAELMTRYSREVIAKVLSDSLPLGLSFDEIVKKLLVHPEFSAMRARRIARTETVTAANGASMIYVRQSKAKWNKVWIAVKDARTRHNHRDIDGTEIDIDTPFKLPDAEMMQPGARKQPNNLAVPASEVVNCRCTVAFEAKRDASGRLIRS